VTCGIVNLHSLEPYLPGLGDRHSHVLWVVVVFLRIKEDLRAVRTVLRRPDEHFHRDLLVDPLDGFHRREWHGGILDSMLGQEDRQ
jgi:hypothetical protein